ncbi:MAG TPA: hypothetical protein VN520_09605, partial [Streptomyces sp.]|uniref:hypothetical protein n=1 Tax=Streptomyces sp. TaxID=1931 RepID=UPI002B907529
LGAAMGMSQSAAALARASAPAAAGAAYDVHPWWPYLAAALLAALAAASVTRTLPSAARRERPVRETSTT